jgi:hypothetical protein
MVDKIKHISIVLQVINEKRSSFMITTNETSVVVTQNRYSAKINQVMVVTVKLSK